MQIPADFQRKLFLFLIGLACVQLCSCATAIKGSESAIRVVAPQDTEVLDQSMQPLPQNWRSPTMFEVFMPCDVDHTLVFRFGERERIVHVQPHFQPVWLIPDILFGLPLAIDFFAQDWYDFDNVHLVIPPDNLAYAELPYEGSPFALTEEQIALKAFMEQYEGPSSTSLYLAATTGWLLGLAVPLALTIDNGASFEANAALVSLGAIFAAPLFSTAFMSLVDSDKELSGDFSAGFGGAILGAFAATIASYTIALPLSYFSIDLAQFTALVSLAFVPPLIASRAWERSRPKLHVLWDRKDYGFSSNYETLEGMTRSNLNYSFGQYLPKDDGLRISLFNIRF